MNPDLNKWTSMTLRVGVIIGLVLMVVGLAISMTGGGDGILYAGMVVLIISPFLGILATFAALILEKDRLWVTVAAVLLVITVAGVVFNF